MMLSSIGSCYKIGMKRIQILIVLCTFVYSLTGMCEEDYQQEAVQRIMQQQLEKRQSTQKNAATFPVKTFDGKETRVPLWQINQISILSERLVAQKNENNSENSSIDITDIVMQKVIAGSKKMVDAQITTSMLDNLVTAFNKGLVSQYTDFFTKLSQEDKNNLINTAKALGADKVVSLNVQVIFPKDLHKKMCIGDDKNSFVVDYLKTFKKKVFNRHTQSVMCVACSPCGDYMVSGSIDVTLILWDVKTGKQIRNFKGLTGSVVCVTYSPCGTYIVSGSNYATLVLWNAGTGERIRTFKGHKETVRCVAYSSCETYIISGSNDGTLILWDVKIGKQIRCFEGHNNWVNCVACSPCGTYIVSGSSDDTLILWDVKTGKFIRDFKGHTSSVGCVIYSPCGTYIVSGSNDGTLILWDVKTGKQIRIFKGHTGSVGCVTYSPCGTYIVSGSHDNSLIWWNVKTGQEIRCFEGHNNWVNCVACSPCGDYMVSGSWDKTLILWSMGNQQALEYIEKNLTLDQQNFVYRLYEARIIKQKVVIDPTDTDYEVYYSLPENVRKLLYTRFLFSILKPKCEGSNVTDNDKFTMLK